METLIQTAWIVTAIIAGFTLGYLISNTINRSKLDNDQRQRDNESNANFVIVLHNWFVECKGFTIHYSEAKTMAEAVKEAKLLKNDLDATFSHCAYTVVPIIKGQSSNQAVYAYVDNEGRLVKIRGNTYFDGGYITPGAPIPGTWKPLYLDGDFKRLSPETQARITKGMEKYCAQNQN